MLHLFQVGAGSGGMPVLDLLARDPRLARVTLVEPDVYQAHNVARHVFPPAMVGRLKADLAAAWLADRRPDLEVRVLPIDLTDQSAQGDLEDAVASADLGVCAADNEKAKYHFDGLMRQHGKPWTLGEVLSGGIGGFVHVFVPNGPCYGCVASHLQRTVKVDDSPPLDYSAPGGPVPETTIPASKAAIEAIASLHALRTLDLFDAPGAFSPEYTTLLWSLQPVTGVFDEAFRPFRFHVARAADCLICRARPVPPGEDDLDAALARALARLGEA